MQLFWHWDTFEYICLFCSPFLLFYKAIKQLSNCFPSINRDFSKLDQLESMTLRCSYAWFKFKRMFRHYGDWHQDKSPDGLIFLVWAVWQFVACSSSCDAVFYSLNGELKTFKLPPQGQPWSQEKTQVFTLYYVLGCAAKQWELQLVFYQQGDLTLLVAVGMDLSIPHLLCL